MPTAARLTAAIILAVLAYMLSQLVKPLLPEGTNFGYFDVINVILGLAAGWFVMGPRAGRGVTHGINNGLAGVFVLLLWGVFVQACYEMFDLAMRNRYKGAFDALTAIVEIGAEYAAMIATPDIVMTSLIGALVAGLVTEFSANRWN